MEKEGDRRHRIRRKENNGKLIFQVNELWEKGGKGKRLLELLLFKVAQLIIPNVSLSTFLCSFSVAV